MPFPRFRDVPWMTAADAPMQARPMRSAADIRGRLVGVAAPIAPAQVASPAGRRLTCAKAMEITDKICGPIDSGYDDEFEDDGAEYETEAAPPKRKKRKQSAAQKKLQAACTKKWHKKSAAAKRKTNYFSFRARFCKK